MIEVVPARLGHVLRILSDADPALRSLIARRAGDPRRAVARDFAQSMSAKVMLIDGVPAAAYGLVGSMLSAEARLWLILSPLATRNLRVFAKACLAERVELLAKGVILTAHVEADYQPGMRFLEHFGFTLGPIRDGQRKAVFSRRTTHALAAPPFVVYGLPRSGTRWMANFLTYGGWTCHHQAAIAMRSLEDMTALFRVPCTGSSEPGASLGWRVLRGRVPEIRMAVVRRPVEECVRSMCRVDLQGMARYDPDVLRRTLMREDRALDDIASQNGALSVGFDDLRGELGCRRIFEHCLPFRFDREWWLAWKDKNVQADVPATLSYYQHTLGGVTAFKRETWRALRRMAYAGAT